VAKLNTVRVVFSVAVNLDWELYRLDVKNAFLHGSLKEEVYMDLPPGFTKGYNGKVCRLKKSLYGLKQSPRAWFDRFRHVLVKIGFAQGHSDHTLFVKRTSGDKVVVLLVYVDDIILTGNDTTGIEDVKKRLAEEFEIKDLGVLKYFLGMEVARSKEGMVVSQRKYILDLLEETGMSGCKPVATPMECNLKLDKVTGEEAADKEQYQRLVGKLIYLAHTRPDISFAVGMVSQFMHSPCHSHYLAVIRILRYLKGTVGEGLLFKKSGKKSVEIFTDADWGGSKEKRSTTGYCTFVWGNLVTWRSKKQSVVARSTAEAEAEFRAMAQGICEILWVKRVLEDLCFNPELPLKLYCDNKAAIDIANDHVQHDRTKHVEIDRHFIKEKLESGMICIPFMPSAQQAADGLTKALMKHLFEGFLNKLGMINIYA
jgi:hypothetical protein